MPRTGHSAVYDPLRQRMIVIGGVNAGPCTAMKLALTGTPTWSPIAVDGSVPPPRAHHSAIYDPDGDRILVFGGFDAASGATRERWEAYSLGRRHRGGGPCRAGVYFYRVQCAAGRASGRLIKID